MSAGLYAYRRSNSPELRDVPWHALIFAAMRLADTQNADSLRAAFPDLWDELQARYDAPGGLIPGDPGAAPSRHVLVIERPPAQEATLKIDGKPRHVARIVVTDHGGQIEVVYDD